MPHKPVLLEETLQWLDLKPGAIVVDGTLGSAGHSTAILKLIGPTGKLIGLDRDPDALKRSREALKDFSNAIILHENYIELEKILDRLNIRSIDAVLLDVGCSSDQLEDPARGFSFQKDGPLDMRMNPEAENSARDLVRDLSEGELEQIFREFGEERYAGRIARSIVWCRDRQPIETTWDLVDAVNKALPGTGKLAHGAKAPWMKRHPATRVFQALRIAVNDELGAVKAGLEAAWRRLKPGGRLAIITFHSLEDRIVKNEFRERHKQKTGRMVVKKFVAPSRAEELENPRARSAKLRVIEKLEVT